MHLGKYNLLTLSIYNKNSKNTISHQFFRPSYFRITIWKVKSKFVFRPILNCQMCTGQFSKVKRNQYNFFFTCNAGHYDGRLHFFLNSTRLFVWIYRSMSSLQTKMLVWRTSLKVFWFEEMLCRAQFLSDEYNEDSAWHCVVMISLF